MKACPKGWHLPSKSEYEELDKAVGGASTAGTKLKAASGWNPEDGIENLDTYGFSALPGGNGYSDGSFSIVGSFGYWWSGSEYGSDGAYYRYMVYSNGNAYWGNYSKYFLFSVRCLRD